MVEEGKTQQEIIKYLEDWDLYLSLQRISFIISLGLSSIKKDVGEATDNKQYPNSFSWMARCIKRAKDPKADKFDPMIIFGFSILNGPSKKVIPYLYKERKKPLKAQIGKKTISFSQAEFTKLPKWMLESERIKFSTEQRQLLLNPDKKPSKFFLRWVGDAVFPDSIKEKMEEVIQRK